MAEKSANRRIWHSGWMRTAVALGLAACLFLMPRPGSAGSQHREPERAAPVVPLPPAGPGSLPVPPVPDPDWLDWVRTFTPASHAQASKLAAAALTLSVNLTDGSIAGLAPSPAPLAARVERAGEEVFSVRVDPVVSPSGFFYQAALTFGCTDGYCIPETLPQRGDVIWVVQGTEALSLTVPLLMAQADVDQNLVSGLAPAGSDLSLYLIPFSNPSATHKTLANSSPLGEYQVRWDGDYTIQPRDWGWVTWSPDERRQVSVRFVAPYLLGQLNSAQIFGFATPSSNVDLQVINAQGELLRQNSVLSRVDGSFVWDDTFNELPPPVLTPGDTIIASAHRQSVSMQLMDVRAQVDLGAGRLFGTAPAGVPLEIALFTGPLQHGDDFPWNLEPKHRSQVQAGTDGGWNASLPFQEADYGYAAASSPDGYHTVARFAVPYVLAYQGSTPMEVVMQGQLDATGAVFTATIQGPSGYLKLALSERTASNGFFILTRQTPAIVTGQLSLGAEDVIHLETLGHPTVRLQLPELTAEADDVRDQVRGRAPAGAQVVIYLYDQLAETTALNQPPASLPLTSLSAVRQGDLSEMIVTADPQGNWVADWTPLGGFSISSEGLALLKLPGGHETAVYFQVSRDCPPSLLSAQVGGNLVSLHVSDTCPGAILRLLDPSGQVKALAFVTPYTDILNLVDGGGHPVAILPGDNIVLEGAGQSRVQAVPRLSVSLQPGSNSISGMALSGERLSIIWNREGDPISYGLVTADSHGAFSFSFPGEPSFEPGDFVQVFHTDPGTTIFSAVGGIPGLSVHLNGYLDEPIGVAWLPPLSPVTITVSSNLSGEEPVRWYTYASSDGGMVFPLPGFQVGDELRLESTDQVLKLVLPYLPVKVEKEAAVVSGDAPPGTRVQVELRNMVDLQDPYAPPEIFVQETTASPEGEFSVSFPDLAPLAAMSGRILYNTPDGERIRLGFSSPQLDVTLGESCVSGTAVSYQQPVTVILKPEDQSQQELLSQSDFQGRFSACFNRAIWPGDHLTLQDPGGTYFHLVVPVLSARADAHRQVLEGQAPPGSRLKVVLEAHRSDSQVVERPVRAGADGRFGVDFSDLDTLLERRGWVILIDPLGNTVTLRFSFYSQRLYFPIVAAQPGQAP